MTGRSLGVVAAIAAAFTLGAMTTVPASAEPAGNPIVELKSVARGQCMTVGTVDPFLVELADCTGAQNQRWERVAAPNGRFHLRSLTDRKCINGEGSLVADWCDDTDQNQRWELVPDASGAVKLKLGVSWPAYADTSWYGEYDFKIFSNDLEDGDHQRWTVTEAGRAPVLPDTAGALVTLESSEQAGRCANGEVMGTCPGSAFQRVELGGGAFQLRAGEVCLVPEPATRFDVGLAGNCATTDPAQQWRLEGPDVFGGHLIRNVGKGTYLSPVDGLHLCAKEAFGKAPQWQRWNLHLA
jgi:hypothetical protein